MKARGHGVIVNDIGVAGEKFDANYICGSGRQRRADVVSPRPWQQENLADNIRVVGINPVRVGTDRHVTLLRPGEEPVRRREPLQGNSKRPSARPSRARARDRRPDGVPRLRPIRLYIGVIFTVDGGIAAGW